MIRPPIAALHLADDAHRSATNPAGWFQDRTIDVTSAAGRIALGNRFREYAVNAVPVMKEMGAATGLFWELEGCKFGSYTGSPQLATAINGMWLKPMLADLCKTLRAAGIEPGCCIRALVVDPLTGAMSLPVSFFENLFDTIEFVRYQSGWGCRTVYIDSNVDGRGLPIDFNVLRKLHRAFPDVQIIPEHQTLDYYRLKNVAPYMDARWEGCATPPEILEDVPAAYSVINVNDCDTDLHRDELVAAVKRGDVLLANGGYRNEKASAVAEIYRLSRVQ